MSKLTELLQNNEIEQLTDDDLIYVVRPSEGNEGSKVILRQNLRKEDVGLDQVDNTSDADKPVSTAQQEELDTKVDKVEGKELSDENYTLDEKNKLDGIEDGAEVNQTDEEIKTQYENNLDTNAYTDSEKTKLDGIEDGAEVNIGDEFDNSGDYENLRARATTKDDVGLDQVDNTSDADKPVSTAQQNALDEKVDTVDIVDDTESTDTDKPLSANQGRILNNNNEDTQSELTDFKNEKGSDSGLAPLDNQGYVPIHHTNPSVRSSKVVDTIADRDAIDTDQRYEGFRVHVIDATADETVNEGNAGYILKAGLTNNDWVKNYENEALDVDSSDDIPEGEQNLYRSPTDKDKLDGIESGAEVNQTDEEIKIQYENNADTNAYTDDEKSKLEGIEDGAEVNQDDAEIKTQYENNADTNAFTDAEQTKLDGIEDGAEVNVDTNLSEGGTGNERTIESSTGENVQISTASSENAGYMSTDDKDKLDGVESGAEVNQTDTEIKTQYESNDDTNAFTDDEKSKLSGIESGAEVNQTDEEIKTQYENNPDTNVFTDDEKSKVHEQNSDTLLAEGTANEVSAEETRNHIDDGSTHFTKSDLVSYDEDLRVLSFSF